MKNKKGFKYSILFQVLYSVNGKKYLLCIFKTVFEYIIHFNEKRKIQIINFARPVVALLFMKPFLKMNL